MKTTIIGTLCAIALIALTESPRLRANESDPLSPHVRSSDSEIRALVAEGEARSPTFRALIARIEQSDGVVHVEWRPCPVPGMLGCLPNWMNDAGAARFIRINLACRKSPRDRQIKTLAHELQHAVEALADPHVRTSAALRSLFLRIGTESGSRSYETSEAVRIGELAARELSAAPVSADAAR